MSAAPWFGIVPVALAAAALGAACTQILGIEQRPLRPDYAQEVLRDSPVIYLRFGEDGGSVAHDETPNHVDGTYPTHGVTFGVPGALLYDTNTAITLDGNNTILVPESADFDPELAFSVEVWVKVTRPLPMYAYIVDHETFSPKRAGWDLLLGSNTEFERWADDHNGGSVTIKEISPNTWHYLVATFEGSSTSTHLERVWVDGQAVASVSNMAQIPKIPGGWSIGGQNCMQCSGNGFSGTLDELAIYNGVLSDTRIAAHYAAATGILDAGR